MAQLSTAEKIGIVARVAGRLAAGRASRNRWLAATLAASRATLRSFARVLHLLWLEVTGFFFLAFAALAGFALSRDYPAYRAGKVGASHMVAAVCFMVVFAYFGLNSFWRTRRKR